MVGHVDAGVCCYIVEIESEWCDVLMQVYAAI